MFDLIGGGEMVRLTLIPTCIAEISHPDKLYVNKLAPVLDNALAFSVKCSQDIVPKRIITLAEATC